VILRFDTAWTRSRPRCIRIVRQQLDAKQSVRLLLLIKCKIRPYCVKKNLETEHEYRSRPFRYQRRSIPENWQELSQFSENRAHVETFDREWSCFWVHERVETDSGKETLRCKKEDPWYARRRIRRNDISIWRFVT